MVNEFRKNERLLYAVVHRLDDLGAEIQSGEWNLDELTFSLGGDFGLKENIWEIDVSKIVYRALIWYAKHKNSGPYDLKHVQSRDDFFKGMCSAAKHIKDGKIEVVYD